VALRPAILLPPKRLSTPRSARQISPTNRGLLLGAPVPTQAGLTPAGLVQLSGRNMAAILRGSRRSVRLSAPSTRLLPRSNGISIVTSIVDMTQQPILQAVGLTKRYGDPVAIDGLSFSVEPGRVTGFLGPNGAGKSTAAPGCGSSAARRPADPAPRRASERARSRGHRLDPDDDEKPCRARTNRPGTQPSDERDGSNCRPPDRARPRPTDRGLFGGRVRRILEDRACRRSWHAPKSEVLSGEVGMIQSSAT
jgi:hypothetical protein